MNKKSLMNSKRNNIRTLHLINFSVFINSMKYENYCFFFD
jgi:hypothetical protein